MVSRPAQSYTVEFLLQDNFPTAPGHDETNGADPRCEPHLSTMGRFPMKTISRLKAISAQQEIERRLCWKVFRKHV